MTPQETIAYKVVGKRHRYGTNACIYIQNHSLKSFKEYLKKCPILAKFFPAYKKNSIIKAVNCSEGIYCFKHKKYIPNFLYVNGIPPKNVKIVKVIGYGPVKKIPDFIPGCGNLHRLKFFKDKREYTFSFKGVISFRKVKVLE